MPASLDPAAAPVCAPAYEAPCVRQRADTAPLAVHAVRVKEKTHGLAAAAPGHANRLLARVARKERERVLAACVPVELAMGEVLMRAGGRTTHAYFLLDAVASLRIAVAGRPNCFEVALVGGEGVVGVPLLLGAAGSTLTATVVKPGAALSIPAGALRLQLLAEPGFRRRMHSYVLVSLAQMAQAVLCTRYHRVDERLARWLLMTQDRAPGETVQATHEFLAATLGVRRAGVTRAAASLQQRQLIAYHRGVLGVLDRQGLEAAACSCYAADRASYADGMRRLAA